MLNIYENTTEIFLKNYLQVLRIEFGWWEKGTCDPKAKYGVRREVKEVDEERTRTKDLNNLSLFCVWCDSNLCRLRREGEDQNDVTLTLSNLGK